MRKVSEYIEHAAECRRLAKRMQKPAHREQLEDMAEAWEMLAREREKQLVKLLETGARRHRESGRRESKRDERNGAPRNFF
jgi:hypothetical protein